VSTCCTAASASVCDVTCSEAASLALEEVEALETSEVVALNAGLLQHGSELKERKMEKLEASPHSSILQFDYKHLMPSGEEELKKRQKEATRQWPSCSQTWGIFGKDPLTRTQVVSSQILPKNFSNFDSVVLHGADNPFVSTEYGFAYCNIAKDASAEWRSIFTKMVQNDTRAHYLPSKSCPSCYDDNGNKLTDQPDPLLDRFATSPRDLRSVFSDPRSTTAVMVREPLSRFVSAFIEKCETNSVYCPMGSASGKPNPSLKDAVEWMLARNPKQLESHWLLQSEYCELSKRVLEYDVVMLYSKDTLAADASCLMELAGIQAFNSDGEEQFWRTLTDLVGTGDRPGTTSHAGSSYTDDEDAEKLKLLFPPKVANLLMAHLQQDYDVFNIPKPEWIAHATGTLYATPVLDLERAFDSLLS